MSSDTDFSHLPDVVFVERDTDKIASWIISVYEGITRTVLYPGHPVRLFLYTLASVIAQLLVKIDYTGKMNLLRYAKGAFLDQIGAMLDVYRLGASSAVATVRFSIANALDYAVMVPVGTRVTADAKLYFATTELAYIVPGGVFVDVPVTALTPGIAANGLVPGQVNRLVDPLEVVVTVSNTTTTAGGADVEDDESFRNRIHLAPEKFTTAGSELSYVYWALSAHPNIGHVEPYSPTPGVVELYVLLKGGVIPDADGPEIQAVREAVSGKKVRPLTDNVKELPAVAEPLDYQVTYYITELQAGYAEALDASIRQAVAGYEEWQTARNGRDINPDELVRACRAAGAKRIVAVRRIRDEEGNVVGSAPLEFTVLSKKQVAQLVGEGERVVFGGVEAA